MLHTNDVLLRRVARLFLVDAIDPIEDDPDKPRSSSLGEAGEGNNDDSGSGSAHPDEHQIRLDTDRSFVLYPVSVS